MGLEMGRETMLCWCMMCRHLLRGLWDGYSKSSIFVFLNIYCLVGEEVELGLEEVFQSVTILREIIFPLDLALGRNSELNLMCAFLSRWP